ncbi:hypothetical protein PANN_53800 [Pseudomonas aeruginosa C-NN2]|nr:hypothetical protein PANN_53800 [Pseudomonas aeruginosa C-NN2]
MCRPDALAELNASRHGLLHDIDASRCRRRWPFAVQARQNPGAEIVQAARRGKARILQEQAQIVAIQTKDVCRAWRVPVRHRSGFQFLQHRQQFGPLVPVGLPIPGVRRHRQILLPNVQGLQAVFPLLECRLLRITNALHPGIRIFRAVELRGLCRRVAFRENAGVRRVRQRQHERPKKYRYDSGPQSRQKISNVHHASPLCQVELTARNGCRRPLHHRKKPHRLPPQSVLL